MVVDKVIHCIILSRSTDTKLITSPVEYFLVVFDERRRHWNVINVDATSRRNHGDSVFRKASSRSVGSLEAIRNDNVTAELP